MSGTQGAYASGSGRRMPCPHVVTLTAQSEDGPADTIGVEHGPVHNAYLYHKPKKTHFLTAWCVLGQRVTTLSTRACLC